MKRKHLLTLLALGSLSYAIIACSDSKTSENKDAKTDLSNLPEADQKLIKLANQVFGVLPDSAINQSINQRGRGQFSPKILSKRQLF